MSKVGLIAGVIAVVVVGVIGLEISKMNKQDFHVVEKSSSPTQVVSDRDLKLEEWHQYTSPLQDFEVLLPTLPQHATDTATDSHHKKEAIVSEADIGTLFMINKITLEDSSENITDLLNHTVDDFIHSIPDSKVLKKQASTYQKNPSIDFSLENPDVVIHGTAFVKGNVLYMLSSTAKRNMFSQNEFDYFVNSFKLQPVAASLPTHSTTPTAPTGPAQKAPLAPTKAN